MALTERLKKNTTL